MLKHPGQVGLKAKILASALASGHSRDLLDLRPKVWSLGVKILALSRPLGQNFGFGLKCSALNTWLHLTLLTYCAALKPTRAANIHTESHISTVVKVRGNAVPGPLKLLASVPRPYTTKFLGGTLWEPVPLQFTCPFSLQ